MGHSDAALSAGDTFFEFCTSSSAATNLNIDASTKAHAFFVSASTAKSPRGLHIHDVTFSMLDAAMENGLFGGIAAITNGIKVRVMTSTVGSSGVIKDFTAAQTIKTNAQFASLGSVSRLREPAAGDDQMLMVWHPPDVFGHPIHLRQGDQFQVVVGDNIAAITSFQVTVHGHYTSAVPA